MMRRLLGSSPGKAVAVIAANLTIMFVNLIRTKLTSVEFGPQVLGAFGQATLTQTLVGALGAAGAITAARIGMSDGLASCEDRWRAARHALIKPLKFGLPLVVLASLLAGRLASLATGDSEWTLLMLCAIAGAVPFVLMQGAFAILHTLGSSRELLSVSAILLLTGAVALGALFVPKSVTAASLSFVVVPVVQVLVAATFSPTLRRVIQLRSSRRYRAPALGAVGLASFCAGALTIGVDYGVRAVLAQAKDLTEVALLLPGQLFAVAGLGVITSAITLVTMTKENSASQKGVSFERGPWRRGVQASLGLLAVSALIVLFARELIYIFFSAELLPAVAPLMVMLAAEPIRALSWVAGSTLLPQRRVLPWFLIQICATAVLVAIAIFLIPSYGSMAIALSYFASCCVGLIGNYGVLRPRLGAADLVSGCASVGGCVALVLGALLGWDRIHVASVSGFFLLLGLAVSTSGSRRRFQRRREPAQFDGV